MPNPVIMVKCEYEYIRHEAQSLIARLINVSTGRVTTTCNKTCKAGYLLKFMKQLAKEYKNVENIHII